MTMIPPLVKKLAGYLLVGPIWALAVALSVFEEDGLPHAAPVALFVLGYIVIGMVTFAWGRMRGFPARTEEGRLSGTNILRCLVMSCIMIVPVGVVAFPCMLLAAHLVR